MSTIAKCPPYWEWPEKNVHVCEVSTGRGSTVFMILHLNATQRLWKHNDKIVPSFLIFPRGLPNKAGPTILPVSLDTKSIGMAKVLPCISGKSAQKVGTILALSYQPLFRHCDEKVTPPPPIFYPAHCSVELHWCKHMDSHRDPIESYQGAEGEC